MDPFSEKILTGIPPVGHDPETSLAETVVYAKYYDQFSSWKWYILEYDRAGTFFGLIVTDQTATAGQFTIQELRALLGEDGKPAVHRDASFEPCKVRELSQHDAVIQELLEEPVPREQKQGGNLIRLESTED